MDALIVKLTGKTGLPAGGVTVRASGSGFVTRFQVRAEFAARYPVHKVGAAAHTELWIPANDLAEFNRNIVGNIQVIAEFR